MAPATDAIACAVRGTPIAKMLRCRHITVPTPLTCAPKQAVALVKRARRQAITTSAQTMVTMPRLTFLSGGHAKLRITVLATGATANAARGIPIATTPRRLSMDAPAIPTCASTRTAARVKRAHRMTLDLDLDPDLDLDLGLGVGLDLDLDLGLGLDLDLDLDLGLGLGLDLNLDLHLHLDLDLDLNLGLDLG